MGTWKPIKDTMVLFCAATFNPDCRQGAVVRVNGIFLTNEGKGQLINRGWIPINGVFHCANCADLFHGKLLDTGD